MTKYIIISSFPVTDLYSEADDISVSRERYLDKQSLEDMLKMYPVAFVIADIGKELKWIDVYKCYDFYKSEVQRHLVDDPNQIFLENFPGHYAYVASEWSGEIEGSIVLLEKFH